MGAKTLLTAEQFEQLPVVSGPSAILREGDILKDARLFPGFSFPVKDPIE